MLLLFFLRFFLTTVRVFVILEKVVYRSKQMTRNVRTQIMLSERERMVLDVYAKARRCSRSEILRDHLKVLEERLIDSGKIPPFEVEIDGQN